MANVTKSSSRGTVAVNSYSKHFIAGFRATKEIQYQAVHQNKNTQPPCSLSMFVLCVSFHTEAIKHQQLCIGFATFRNNTPSLLQIATRLRKKNTKFAAIGNVDLFVLVEVPSRNKKRAPFHKTLQKRKSLKKHVFWVNPQLLICTSLHGPWITHDGSRP